MLGESAYLAACCASGVSFQCTIEMHKLKTILESIGPEFVPYAEALSIGLARRKFNACCTI